MSYFAIGVLTDQACSFDGGKLVKGRKRHILVDTLGLLIAVVVTATNVSDQAGAKQLFAKLNAQAVITFQTPSARAIVSGQ